VVGGFQLLAEHPVVRAQAPDLRPEFARVVHVAQGARARGRRRSRRGRASPSRAARPGAPRAGCCSFPARVGRREQHARRGEDREAREEEGALREVGQCRAAVHATTARRTLPLRGRARARAARRRPPRRGTLRLAEPEREEPAEVGSAARPPALDGHLARAPDLELAEDPRLALEHHLLDARDRDGERRAHREARRIDLEPHAAAAAAAHQRVIDATGAQQQRARLARGGSRTGIALGIEPRHLALDPLSSSRVPRGVGPWSR